MAYGTVKVDNITFDNGGSDQNVTISGLYRATTSGVTVSGTIAAGTVSGVTVIGSTTVSGVTVTGTTANFTSGNFGTLVTVTGTSSANIVSGVTVIGSTTVSGATVTGTTANFTSGNFSNLISAAATMSGALIMANQQQVRFREAVGNGVNHIALQAPAIVSADQTITLPDQTGTVVTTGDNGSVTSTMILNSTIVNDDISASAAIADTKLATIATAGKISDSALPATISSNITGNAATATILQTTRTIGGVSFNGSANINLPGVNTAGNQNTTGSSGSCTGNAATATNPAGGGSFITSSNIGSQSVNFATNATNATNAVNFQHTGNVFSGANDTTIGTTSLRSVIGAGVCHLCDNDGGGTSNILTVQRSASGGNVVRFVRTTSTVGTISVTASATAYNTSSDYRLKENVTPLDGAIARLSQLPVHRFNFIADPDTVVDGFIAHEAAAVVPECVTGVKDEEDEDGNPIYQGIDQSKVVPLLTAALQEAIAKIELLEQRLTAAGIA